MSEEEEEEVSVDTSEACIYPGDYWQEVLRLDTEARTFSQELVTSQAVMVCKAAPVKVSGNKHFRLNENVTENDLTLKSWGLSEVGL